MQGLRGSSFVQVRGPDSPGKIQELERFQVIHLAAGELALTTSWFPLTSLVQPLHVL